MTTLIELHERFFDEKERVLLTQGTCSASLFRFRSGVCGVRLRNEVGELVMLPFQGQQIWSANFLGRQLTMRGMFEQPYPTRDFLATFGGFMQHCGVTAMGSPGPEDDHPLHGELPNAPFQRAFLTAGEDEEGVYIGLGGGYEHAVAFGAHYLAEPLVRLRAGSGMLEIQMAVTNLSGRDMPLMYLFHANFRPVDHARLVYSAPSDPEHLRVRASLPGHVKAMPGYREFIDRLVEHPEDHLVLKPGLAFDPEVVFFIKYRTDEQGWAYALQVHPDGAADAVRHKPGQLPHGIRWICRTPDQDALGFEAGTASVEGRTAEEAKGNLGWLGPGERWLAAWEAGALGPVEAGRWVAKAQEIASTPHSA